ncbi:MAG: hypothetical protein F6K47_30365 [Symploca sp. SIO2E6]|nr:hypothetical protein [Symploca sp. SIO2E6]
MEYLVTPPESTNWKISESYFIQHLEKQWSGIEIHKTTNPDDYYVLEWVVKVSSRGHRLDGALHRDGQGISLDGYLEDCARFVIWFRSLVPPTQNLVFYDQGYNCHVELEATTTESEIMQPLEASWGRSYVS